MKLDLGPPMMMDCVGVPGVPVPDGVIVPVTPGTLTGGDICRLFEPVIIIVCVVTVPVVPPLIIVTPLGMPVAPGVVT
jgi:hypothetical protein